MSILVKIIVFIIASVGVTWVSWPSLGDYRSHGFYRFFALAATFFLTMTAKVEEAENIRFFGDAYKNYMKHNKMFIPFLF